MSYTTVALDVLWRVHVHSDLKVCDHVICQSRDDVIGACAVVVAVRRRGASPTWPCNALTRGLIIPAQLLLPHYGLVFPAFVESAMFVRGEDGDWWSSAQASVSEWQSTPLTGTYARVPLFVWTSRLHSHSLHECAEYCLRVLYEWVQFVNFHVSITAHRHLERKYHNYIDQLCLIVGLNVVQAFFLST